MKFILVENNETKYFKDKECTILHREDGPAVECHEGYKVYYLNGNLHREDGPAIEWRDGSKVWYLNGKLHREGGPAVEYSNGKKEWWFNGNQYLKIHSDKHWINVVKTLILE